MTALGVGGFDPAFRGETSPRSRWNPAAPHTEAFMKRPLAPSRGRTRRLNQQVATVLHTLRPLLRTDGGDIELVEVENGVVKVRFLGACVGCPSNPVTLKDGVERTLKARIPEIREVIAV